MGENAQRFGLAVLALQTVKIALRLGIAAQEQHGRLTEGPLEERVADLLARVAVVLAGGLLRALHPPAIRDEILYPWEAADVVDLVEDHQRQGLADAGHRAQA